MKILITCQFFNYCSGSAMYVHDLAIELKKRGNDVTILSDLGGEIANSAIKAGIRLIDFSQIFSIQNETFDVIHLNQSGPAEMALEFFPNIPSVMTLHSELNIESPYHHSSIKKYIAIRPSIAEKYSDLTPTTIYNGIDFERFNTKNAEKVKADKEKLGITKSVIVFPGTFDVLREKALADLVKKGKHDFFDVVLIGRNMLPYKPPAGLTIVPETFFIEKFIEASEGVGGILLGRTCLEAWACGKDYYCYDVNNTGDVLGFEILPPPADMSQYDIRFMTDKVEEIYKEIAVVS